MKNAARTVRGAHLSSRTGLLVRFSGLMTTTERVIAAPAAGATFCTDLLLRITFENAAALLRSATITKATHLPIPAPCSRMSLGTITPGGAPWVLCRRGSRRKQKSQPYDCKPFRHTLISCAVVVYENCAGEHMAEGTRFYRGISRFLCGFPLTICTPAHYIDCHRGKL